MTAASTTLHGAAGIDVTFSRGITISNCEAARNTLNGIRVSDSDDVLVRGNLAEGNDGGGIIVDCLFDGYRKLGLRDNIARNNGRFGIEAAGAAEAGVQANTTAENGRPEHVRVAARR